MTPGETDRANIAWQFNSCINNRDINGLTALMTADHCFIDSAENHFTGKEKCILAWRGFFSLFPDYRNVIGYTSVKENTVYMSGHSECSDKRLEGQCLWTATLQGRKIAEWRVYIDNEENRRKLGF